MGNGIEMLPGERVVLSSDEDILVLTNLRVRFSERASGSEQVVSITLDSVASVGLASSSSPILLILAAIAAVAGFAAGEQLLMVMLVAAAILVAAYFLTRKKVISIASSGGRQILAPATGLGMDACMKFINGVEREKLTRQNA